MKNVLIIGFMCSALWLNAGDLLRNAPWRFVSASGGSGSVEKIADGTRRVHSDSAKGFVSFAHSRDLPIVPGNKYRISMTIVRSSGNTGMVMHVSVAKRRPWATVKAQGEPGKPETLNYEFTAAPGENRMRVHAIVSGFGNVTISDVSRTVVTAAAEPAVQTAAAPAVNDLLRTTSWRTATAEGGKGKTLPLADGGQQIISEADKGLVSFANSKNLPIVPGKTYLVKADFIRSNDSPFTIHVQIEKQRPWVAVKADGIAGNPEQIAYRFTAKPGETWMRVHCIVFKRNTVTISRITCQEVAASDSEENWLATRPWRTVTAGGGKGSAVRSGIGQWLITTDSAKGVVSFANAANQQIIPGKNYRISAKIIRSSDAVGVNMLNQIGVRRPWPAVKANGIAGQEETLVYNFTAGNNENNLRIHFIVSGQGTVKILQVNVQELTGSELRAAAAARKVTATDFRGAELRRCWTPVKMLRRTPDKIQAFRAAPFGGIECNDLDWQADKIKSIDLRMAASEPGYIRLDFTTAAGQKSYLSCAAYPHAMRDYTFNVASNPAWQGKITGISISWRAYERNCELEFERITANSRANIIPFAADNTARVIPIIALRPRSECELSWQGQNPGMVLTFFDRFGKTLDKFTLPAGKTRDKFTVPEMCTRAELAVNRNSDAPGFPCVEELNWSKPDKKACDWRGKWIWSNTEFGPTNSNVWFKKEFVLDGEVSEGAVIFTADDMFTAYINGQELCSGNSWRTPVRADAGKLLKPGQNTVVIKTHNVSAWGGLIGEIYAQAGNKNVFIATDSSWQYKIGGDLPPEKYHANALELGAPPTSPWGDLVYSYVGPKSKIIIKSAGTSSAVITAGSNVPVKTDLLTFKLRYPDGSTRRVSGKVSPATDQWHPGKEIKINLALPEVAAAGVTAEFDSLFLDAPGKLCTLPAADLRKKELPTARIAGAGSRAYIVINGEKYPPIYYDGYHKPTNSWMLDKAQKGGCKIVRITCSMHEMWKSENYFDFSILDRFMDEFAVNAPDIKVILQIELTMPDWWLKKYPDDTVTYHNGIPRSQAHDRQALASARWRQDGSHSLREMIRHIKNSPYADRIFAIGPAEGWNCEWFWSVHRGAASGYSKSDYATFRQYLKETYGNNAAFAQAWGIPGVTFENFQMPQPADIDRLSCGELLDPVKDRRTIDYFRFRNRALGDAIETFAKVIKEESGNRYLVGVYYGYFVMFSHVNRKLQTVGHLEIERLARSPYVDIFWAPSLYHWRQIGMSDGVMQAAETLTSHGKLVVVEQDIRTFSEPSHMQAGNGRTDNPHQTINAMIRAFGMLTARGIGTHWYDMHEIWFRENVLLEVMKSINSAYMALPPVKNLTPAEVCIVSDQESAFYTRHNFGSNPHKGTVYELLRTFNHTGVPFRHVFVSDLLEKDRIPAHKFYILTNLLMLTPEKYRQLEARFAAEKATVLHLYATGVTRPDSAPSAANMEELLGMKFKMTTAYSQIEFISAPGEKLPDFSNVIASRPWFYPVSGFDKILGTDREHNPVLVQKRRHNVNHYFSTLTTPHVDILRELIRRAGVHMYSHDSRHIMHIGNDVIFITATGDGTTSVNLPAGRKLRGIIGKYQGKVFRSGEKFTVSNGDCYGFAVE